MQQRPKLCVRVTPVAAVSHEDAPAQAGAGEEGVDRVAGGRDPEVLCTLAIHGEGMTVFGLAGF